MSEPPRVALNETVSPLSPSDERTWAMLAHLSILLNLVSGALGVVAALAIYLLYRERSRYVAYHSLQAFFFQLVAWLGGGVLTAFAWGVTVPLIFLVVGLFLIPLAVLVTLLPAVAVVYGVVGAVRCSQGEDFRYWLVGDWLRDTLTG